MLTAFQVFAQASAGREMLLGSSGHSNTPSGTVQLAQQPLPLPMLILIPLCCPVVDPTFHCSASV